MGRIIKWIMAKFTKKNYCENCVFYYIDEKSNLNITRENLLKFYGNRIDKIILDNLVERKHKLVDVPLCGKTSKFLIYDREKVIRFSKLASCHEKNKNYNCSDFKERKSL